MAKKPKPQSKLNPVQQGIHNQVSLPSRVTQVTQTFEGPIPHPTLLSQYDALVPGAAERILTMAESEAAHRHSLEQSAMTANIESQRRQLSIAEEQQNAVFRSDWWGQLFGFAVSTAAVCGAIALALNGQPWVAGVLAGLPIAAIVRAFRESHKNESKSG